MDDDLESVHWMYMPIDHGKYLEVIRVVRDRELLIRSTTLTVRYGAISYGDMSAEAAVIVPHKPRTGSLLRALFRCASSTWAYVYPCVQSNNKPPVTSILLRCTGQAHLPEKDQTHRSRGRYTSGPPSHSRKEAIPLP